VSACYNLLPTRLSGCRDSYVKLFLVTIFLAKCLHCMASVLTAQARFSRSPLPPHTAAPCSEAPGAAGLCWQAVVYRHHGVSSISRLRWSRAILLRLRCNSACTRAWLLTMSCQCRVMFALWQTACEHVAAQFVAGIHAGYSLRLVSG
jgi:hypothetical protein